VSLNKRLHFKSQNNSLITQFLPRIAIEKLNPKNKTNTPLKTAPKLIPIDLEQNTL
jgi:hypothetical protein